MNREQRFLSIFSKSSGYRGVTLVELAIVMVVLGILVGLGASLLGPLTKRAKTIEARETVNAAVDAVVGYGVTNNRIPNAAQFGTTVRAQVDAWGDPIQYIFDNNLATSVCDRTASNITVRVCTNAACAAFTTVSNVAFMVLSPGGNYNNQTAGSQAVAAPVALNTYQTGIAVDNYAGDFIRAIDEYDDIVKWVTLPELQSKMGCSRCTAYEVWNNLGAVAYFRVNGMGCASVANNTMITSIGPGGSVNGYTDLNCTVPTAPALFAYTQAVTIDVNRNCAVNFNSTDR